jgi:hypothetical protein
VTTGESQGGPAYPTTRAFVVQLADPTPLGTDLAGRVEHVSSGRAGHFASLAELARFLADVVRTGPASEGGTRG